MLKKCFLALCGVVLCVPAYARNTTVEQELIRVEHQWKQAVVDRDPVALGQFYADEYISTDSEGLVFTRSQDIEIDTAGVSRLTAFKFDDLRVQAYGDVAVVTGRITTTGILAGAPSQGMSRFTDVFVKRDGRWLCVAAHTTAIGE
jgi:ketosteroid isomerase-like protein